MKLVWSNGGDVVEFGIALARGHGGGGAAAAPVVVMVVVVVLLIR